MLQIFKAFYIQREEHILDLEDHLMSLLYFLLVVIIDKYWIHEIKSIYV